MLRAVRRAAPTLRVAAYAWAPRRWGVRTPDQGEVNLGGVSCPVATPADPELVPIHSYLPDDQETLAQVRWMMQKWNLQQDMYLLGPPGPKRRWLAFKFCHSLMKEVEYLALSRDTTEADIKQRREIQDGTLVYVDQPAVRAAIHGRVLVLDGVERVERNVLPIINNLLENREMSLEDGRFLTNPGRYAELLHDHTKEELDAMGLIPVSPNFRVISLGLPVPRYDGVPLDPPLRSRFQCLDVTSTSLGMMLAKVKATAPRLSVEDAEAMVGFLSGKLAAEQGGTDQDREQHFPDVLEEDLLRWAASANAFPADPLVDALRRVYPYHVMVDAKKDDGASRKFMTSVLRRYSLHDPDFSEASAHRRTPNVYKIDSIKPGGDVAGDSKRHALVTFTSKKGEAETYPCGCGESAADTWSVPEGILQTTSFRDTLVDLVKDHCLSRHLCIVGPRGCGKSALAKTFASMLGYEHKQSVVHCHWDMSARDLLQRRVTEENGNTTWQAAVLTDAAIHGRVVVLDGVDKFPPGVLASLGRLFVDGEVTLYDGTILRCSDDYNTLLAEGFTREELTAKKVLEIHPAFRIIALAHTAEDSEESKSWVEGEVQHFFAFHKMPAPPIAEINALLTHANPHPAVTEKILKLHAALLQAHTTDSAVPVMSLRQLLRVAKASHDLNHLHAAVSDVLLVDLMPQFAADRVRSLIASVPIQEAKAANTELAIVKTDEALSIGPVTAKILPLNAPEDAALIPNILFHENPEHLGTLKKLLHDLNGSDHVLMIGKQGVGKNRLVDHMLQLLERPRQYVQLHRDSTVASLTVRPEVIEGKLVWEDAPLVKAVRQGHILVVDEIDKAPLEVVGVLKGLIEDRELLLSDGRRVVDHINPDGWTEDDGAIVIHPNFRLIALANVPGFPFLGNDFFAACGDLFRCHLIDNPTKESTLEVLQQYGPSVPVFVLNTMVDAFDKLQEYVAEGLLAYPYSLRELVAVVKHLEKFPQDGLVVALKNVFNFDAYDDNSKEIIEGVFESHGIPLSGSPRQVHQLALAPVTPLPAPEVLGKFFLRDADARVVLSMVAPELKTYQWPHSPAIDARVIEGRDEGKFDERLYTLPVPGVVRGLASTADNGLHALVEVDGSAALMTWHGKNLYAPVFGRPCSLDHGSSRMLRLELPLQDDRDSPAAGYRVHAFADSNTVAVVSTTSPVVLLVDPKRRTGVYYAPSILKANLPPHARDAGDAGTLPQLLGAGGDDATATAGGSRWKRGLFSFSGTPDRAAVDPADTVHNDTSAYRYGRVVLYNAASITIYDHQTSAWVDVALEGTDAGTTITAVRSVSAQQLLITTDAGTFMAGFDPKNPTAAPTIMSVQADEATKGVDGKALTDWAVTAPCTGAYPAGAYVPSTPELVWGEVKSTGGDAGTTVTVRRRPDGIPGRSLSAQEESGAKGWASQVGVGDGWHGVLSGDGDIVIIDGERNPGARVFANREKVLGQYPQPAQAAAHASLAALPNGCLAVTSPSLKQISIYDTNLARVQGEWSRWSAIVGGAKGGPGGADGSAAGGEPLSLQYSNSKVQPSSLKHGKEDPENTPHVGGNTWAGGTGGTDTAGLGGRVGPYRLDAGHPIHQVSDEAKAAVPEHLKQQAKAMGQEALKDRLKEIQMSSAESSMYNRAHDAVRREVSMVQTLLKGLKSKDGERVWLKNQMDGVWDESKLVEGLTGEKGIFKKRGVSKENPSPLKGKKKRIIFCMDCSASMYRFNQMDGRLDRIVETAIMVTEAFKGMEDRIEYSMVGHSGDSAAIPLVDFNAPPQNQKERLQVVLSMVAHTQYCWSGDNTLPSIEHAIKVAAEKDADQRFVFVISDANLRRYGITTREIARIVKSDPKVHVFCIFIASMGQEAERIKRDLPAGHGHVCYNSNDLPSILKRIFMATNLLK